MNMRKNLHHITKKHKKGGLCSSSLRMLTIGIPLILAVLLRLLYEIKAYPILTEARAAYFGGALEYPLAALMLLTGGVLLVELIAKKERC